MSALGKLLRSAKPQSMADQYAGVLTPDQLPEAARRLAELRQSLASATPTNSCGSALLRLARRARLLRDQIIRSVDGEGEL
jgi:hypothetical protein